jgi:transposase
LRQRRRERLCVSRQSWAPATRTVVTDRKQYGPGLHRYNRTFLDCAHHFGFLPRLCRPYRAKTKGKVERLNRLPARELLHFAREPTPT